MQAQGGKTVKLFLESSMKLAWHVCNSVLIGTRAKIQSSFTGHIIINDLRLHYIPSIHFFCLTVTFKQLSEPINSLNGFAKFLLTIFHLFHQLLPTLPKR